MENPIVAALAISLLGMPLLFLALAFFYGLLSLMMATIRDRPSQSAPPEEGRAGGGRSQGKGMGDDDMRLQAAALAVALARAQAEQAPVLAGAVAAGEAVTQHVSPWWTLHHQRQMTTGSSRRTQ